MVKFYKTNIFVFIATGFFIFYLFTEELQLLTIKKVKRRGHFFENLIFKYLPVYCKKSELLSLKFY